MDKIFYVIIGLIVLYSLLSLYIVMSMYEQEYDKVSDFEKHKFKVAFKSLVQRLKAKDMPLKTFIYISIGVALIASAVVVILLSFIVGVVFIFISRYMASMV